MNNTENFATGLGRVLSHISEGFTIMCQCHYCNSKENLIDIKQTYVYLEKLSDYRPSIFFKICKSCNESISPEQQEIDTRAVMQEIADKRNKQYREEDKQYETPKPNP